MTQTTILSAAQAASQSLDITVAPGTVVTVGLFAASKINAGIRCPIHLKGPNGSRVVGWLTGSNISTAISAPGTYFVTRPAISSYGLNVGIFTES